jgi:nicotinic acid mononucleotide adenylyltransferase
MSKKILKIYFQTGGFNIRSINKDNYDLYIHYPNNEEKKIPESLKKKIFELIKERDLIIDIKHETLYKVVLINDSNNIEFSKKIYIIAKPKNRELETDAIERDRLKKADKEKADKEKADKEKADKERVAKEKADKERVAKERTRLEAEEKARKSLKKPITLLFRGTYNPVHKGHTEMCRKAINELSEKGFNIKCVIYYISSDLSVLSKNIGSNKIILSQQDRAAMIEVGWIEEKKIQHKTIPNSFDDIDFKIELEEATKSLSMDKLVNIISEKYKDYPIYLVGGSDWLKLRKYDFSNGIHYSNDKDFNQIRAPFVMIPRDDYKKDDTSYYKCNSDLCITLSPSTNNYSSILLQEHITNNNSEGIKQMMYDSQIRILNIRLARERSIQETRPIPKEKPIAHRTNPIAHRTIVKENKGKTEIEREAEERGVPIEVIKLERRSIAQLRKQLIKLKYLKYDHITKGNVDPKLNRDVKYLYLRYKNKYLRLKEKYNNLF